MRRRATHSRPNGIVKCFNKGIIAAGVALRGSAGSAPSVCQSQTIFTPIRGAYTAASHEPAPPAAAAAAADDNDEMYHALYVRAY